MKTVAITNHKGGVGKTATALALVENLSQKGYSVLLVDLDQQMNATKVTRAKIKDVITIYDLLTTEKYSTRDARQNWGYGDVIPGDALLGDAEVELARLDTPLTMLADALEDVSDLYDFAVVDCPPSLGYVARNAFVAADIIVIVVNPDAASVDGFGRIYSVIKQIKSNRRLNPNLEIGGVLINKYSDRGKLDKNINEQLPKLLKDTNVDIYSTRIHQCVAVPQAASAKLPLLDYAPGSTVVGDFAVFTEEFLKKLDY